MPFRQLYPWFLIETWNRLRISPFSNEIAAVPPRGFSLYCSAVLSLFYDSVWVIRQISLVTPATKYAPKRSTPHSPLAYLRNCNSILNTYLSLLQLHREKKKKHFKIEQRHHFNLGIRKRHHSVTERPVPKKSNKTITRCTKKIK